MNILLIALYIVGFIALVVLTQDLHIFPGAFISKLKSIFRPKKKIPPQIESTFISSKDGTKLEVWRYTPENTSSLSDYVAIIFHGNGGPVENFLFVQMWFGELGIPSYSFDYRGFGRSDGWPSESGIYQDSDAVWEYVKESEKISSDKLVAVGISVGSGAASRAAALHQPKLLLLSSAFTDLKNVVQAQPLVGLLSPFVRYKFSTRSYVRELERTHLLLARGMKDKIVPPVHSELLQDAYQGSGKSQLFSAEEAGHNLAFYALKDELKQACTELLQE